MDFNHAFQGGLVLLAYVHMQQHQPVSATSNSSSGTMLLNSSSNRAASLEDNHGIQFAATQGGTHNHTNTTNIQQAVSTVF